MDATVTPSGSFRASIRSVFALRDSPVRWPIALQAGLAMGIPAAAFTIAGRQDLGLLASIGAFTALYLAARSRRERAVILPLIALGLIAAAGIGVVTSSNLVLSLVGLFLVAAISAVLCLGLGVGPPGAVFFALVTGVSNHLVAPASLGGAEINGLLVLVMIAIGCTVAYLVVLSPLAIPRVRRRDVELHRERVRMRFVFDSVTRVILFRLVLAAGIAVLVSAPLGVHRVYWVLLTVIAILQNGHGLTLTAIRGVHRVLGTLVGLAVFALLVLWSPSGLWLVLVLATLQFAVEIVVIRNYGLALVLITPLALTIATQGHAVLATVVTDRLVDTLLGAVIAMLVLLIALTARRMRVARVAGAGSETTEEF